MRRKISHVVKHVLGVDEVVLVVVVVAVAFLVDVVADILLQPFFRKTLVGAPLRLHGSVYGSGTPAIPYPSKRRGSKRPSS